jgi:hypothetical protein
MSAVAHVCSWKAHVHEHWCTWQHERLCSCQSTVRVTRGVLRGRRSTVISPAASSSRKARYFANRVTPSFASWPFGRGEARVFGFPGSVQQPDPNQCFRCLGGFGRLNRPPYWDFHERLCLLFHATSYALTARSSSALCSAKRVSTSSQIFRPRLSRYRSGWRTMLAVLSS